MQKMVDKIHSLIGLNIEATVITVVTRFILPNVTFMVLSLKNWFIILLLFFKLARLAQTTFPC